MQTIILRERNIKKQKIQAILYKHTQQIGNYLIEFERGLFIKPIFQASPQDDSTEITHYLNTQPYRETISYKNKGKIFARFKDENIPFAYLWTLKLVITLIV